MESWGVFFLGVIALSAVVQIAFLVALLVFGRKLAQRLDVLQTRLDRELSPALGNFARASRAVAEIADLATVRARRLDLALGGTIDRIGDTVASVHRFVSHPLRPIATMALFKAFQRGIEVFFAPDRGAPPDRPAPSRRRVHGEDDEHFFV